MKARGPTLEEARADPHFDRRLGVETLAPRQKKARPTLHFNQKGKFVRMAESIRQEEKMEALKARIAEAARKTGLEEDLEADGGLGRRIKKQPPPAVEWWDVAFLQGDSYDDLDSEHAKKLIDHGCSDLVQHPIPIPAPGDKREAAVRPLMLTKKVYMFLLRALRSNLTELLLISPGAKENETYSPCRSLARPSGPGQDGTAASRPSKGQTVQHDARADTRGRC